ncbi:MAG: adenylate/guanylate cyclase domain-containing protein [Acidobacteria bacterium]|nr:adenylate/guanylate cyclase domain-containing protein [Acidobacteriota bacterium]
MKRKSRAELARLLQERNEHPERMAEMDAEIKATFGETHAILIMDMSGFSRVTLQHGIIHFLAMIHRMNEIARPAIEEHGGEVVKFEADNAFAVFDEVENAVEAAIDILKRLSAANTMLPPEFDMYGKFGIGYGEVLMLADDDLFGAEVNLASKLGEDLAERNEILLTEDAYKRIKSQSREYEECFKTISGLELRIHKIKYGDC